MRTMLLCWGFTLLFYVNASSQYYSQFFDGRDTSVSNSLLIQMDSTSNRVWEIGPPQKRYFNASASSPNAIVTSLDTVYQANDTSSFSVIADPDYFWSFGILAFQWNQKLDMDTTTEGGIVEFSVDEGVNWENVVISPYVYSFYGFDVENIREINGAEFGFSGHDTLWKNVWLCFDISWVNLQEDSTIQFRFTFVSDSNHTERDGWMIDNMSLSQTFIHTINKKETAEYMSVGPNPCKGKINITTQKVNQFHIIEDMQLMDLQGRVIEKFGQAPTKFTLDISHHPDGIYLLKVKTNLKEETFKINLSRS
ncbi:MAG: T9SS type A sorting domain-containing protein [Bacteroidota bacterium]